LVASAAAEAASGFSDGGHPVRHVMMLLRRHYGKLAAALLLVLVLYGMWWVLPVRPRPVCTLPEVGFLHSSSQNGDLLVTTTKGPDPSNAVWYPLRLWDLKSGRQVAACSSNQLQSPSRPVLSLNNRWLAAVDCFERRDAEVKIFELSTNSVRICHADATPHIGLELRFSPNSQLLTAIPGPWPYELGNVRIWDVATGEVRWDLAGQSGPSAFSPDSQLLVTAGEAWKGDQHFDRRYLLDRRPQGVVWNLTTGQVEFFAQGPPQTDLGVAAFSADGKKLAFVWKPVDIQGITPLHVDIWDVGKRQPIASRQGLVQYLVYCHADATLEELFLVDFTAGQVQVIEMATGRPRFTMTDFGSAERVDWPRSVANGRLIETTCHVQTNLPAWRRYLIEKLPFLSKYDHDWTTELHLWDTATGQRLPAMPVAYPFEVTSDGRYLFFQPDDRTIEVWDIPPRKPLGGFLGLAGLLLMVTLGGFWWQARRRKRKAAFGVE
jgi:WD40 repeat protein